MAGKEWRGSEISCGLPAYPRRDRPPPEARGGRLRLGPQSLRFAIAGGGDNSNTIPAFKTSLTIHVAALRDEGPCSYRSFTGRAGGAATDSLRTRPARQPSEGSARAPLRALCPMLQGFTGGAFCRAAPPPEPWVGNDLGAARDGSRARPRATGYPKRLA